MLETKLHEEIKGHRTEIISFFASHIKEATTKVPSCGQAIADVKAAGFNVKPCVQNADISCYEAQ
jgi:hypothetical protein